MLWDAKNMKLTWHHLIRRIHTQPYSIPKPSAYSSKKLPSSPAGSIKGGSCQNVVGNVSLDSIDENLWVRRWLNSLHLIIEGDSVYFRCNSAKELVLIDFAVNRTEDVDLFWGSKISRYGLHQRRDHHQDDLEEVWGGRHGSCMNWMILFDGDWRDWVDVWVRSRMRIAWRSVMNEKVSQSSVANSSFQSVQGWDILTICFTGVFRIGTLTQWRCGYLNFELGWGLWVEGSGWQREGGEKGSTPFSSRAIIFASGAADLPLEVTHINYQISTLSVTLSQWHRER